jgi:hypothetical protein
MAAWVSFASWVLVFCLLTLISIFMGRLISLCEIYLLFCPSEGFCFFAVVSFSSLRSCFAFLRKNEMLFAQLRVRLLGYIP